MSNCEKMQNPNCECEECRPDLYKVNQLEKENADLKLLEDNYNERDMINRQAIQTLAEALVEAHKYPALTKGKHEALAAQYLDGKE